jgi:salicylate hydroxylase
MSKIFNYWGMHDKVGNIGVVTERIVMSRRTRHFPLCLVVFTTLLYCAGLVENAYLLGIHCWEHEMLEEAGGEFIALYVRAPCIDRCIASSTCPCLLQHSQLRKMLLETAHELGATTRTNAEVVEIAEDCRSVRLASGEVIEADIIIGADGSQGMCRRLVVSQDPPKATGVMMFKYVFRPSLLSSFRFLTFL